MRDAFLESASRLMSITENGKPVTLTQREAVGRAEFIAAIKGSSHAQRNYLARDAQFRHQFMEKVREDHQQWRDYIDKYDRVAQDFASRNVPLPDYFPHPDELHFRTVGA